MLENNMNIVPIDKKNREKVNTLLSEEWNGLNMIVRGKIISLKNIDGMVLYENDIILGIITYIISEDTLEIISLNSFKERRGIGSKLIIAVMDKANNDKCSSIKLITTNDNINAIKFYQRRGFVISNIYIDSIKNYRKIKPDIPTKGEFDIPIRDEIEFRLNIFH